MLFDYILLQWSGPNALWIKLKQAMMESKLKQDQCSALEC